MATAVRCCTPIVLLVTYHDCLFQVEVCRHVWTAKLYKNIQSTFEKNYDLLGKHVVAGRVDCRCTVRPHIETVKALLIRSCMKSLNRLTVHRFRHRYPAGGSSCC